MLTTVKRKLRKVSQSQSTAAVFCRQCSFHALVLIVLLILIIPISISIYNSPPRRYLSSKASFDGPDSVDPRINHTVYDADRVPTYNVLLDAHSHSTYSDGGLSPEQNIIWHIKNGFNAMVLTDHNTASGGVAGQRIALEKYSDKIVVIPGIEWTNCRCHMGLIGLTEDVPLYKFPTNEQIKEIIDLTHSKGGFAVLNHYPWSTWANLEQPTLQEFLEMGIDFIEVVNGDTFDFSGYTFARRNNLRYLVGTDFHMGSDVASWNVLQVNDGGRYNASEPINARYLNQSIIMDALKNANISFLFDAVGSKIGVLKELSQQTSLYTFLSPWIQLGSFFHTFFELKKGMYSFVDGSCTKEEVIVHTPEIICLAAWIIFFFLLVQLTLFFGATLINYLRGRRHGNKGDNDGSIDSNSPLGYDMVDVNSPSRSRAKDQSDVDIPLDDVQHK
ncbi:hypothetical protein SAMD00019534_043140 [Acytostelium subglobosum LB1]|uniref:hypothetical protein n=1 Tax=Acytostelium subglobosum LB1 TaxID=1410327 RepID=UPI000644CE3D|nr:hypothetical protein SAMD00019534_043140 [Acytostelium subglobosum LB1]GAM21139.1 hypothetical protein SAMD00019534_043140 [Acytostelium subglobosum LB1]|eukprot:XP_012756273.1 hypothetical protein SAMD00019534_043140 [Acytostelium subglobosum LB1]